LTKIDVSPVKKMTGVLRFWWGKYVSDLSRRRHRVERARDDLGRARALNIVSRFRLE
jgi:hypothetical protein